MPEYYLIPKRVARRAPRLAAAARSLESATFRAVFALLRRLPLATANRFAGALFAALGAHTSKFDKALDNLAIAFPERDEAWRRATAREIFRHLGYAAVELVKLDQIWDEREHRLEFVMEPAARDHLEAGRPAVMVTAHVGPWQATNLIAQRYGLRISTIYARESSAAMRDAMARLRAKFGVGWIASDEGVRPLIRELEAGHSIGMAMDTRLDTGKLLPFFGREALTNTSAAGLALRTGAALIPVRAERLPGERYRITVCDPLACDAPPGTDAKDRALLLTTAVNRTFEQWIREAPEQWICLKRRWPKEHRL
jgi:KDO2-lipid IV(A) lauroyltransferase